MPFFDNEGGNFLIPLRGTLSFVSSLPPNRISALQFPLPYRLGLEDHVFPERNRIVCGVRSCFVRKDGRRPVSSSVRLYQIQGAAETHYKDRSPTARGWRTTCFRNPPGLWPGYGRLWGLKGNTGFPSPKPY